MQPRLGIVIALAACASSSQEPPAPAPVGNHAGSTTTADPHAAAIGTWRIPPGQRRRERPGVVAIPGVDRFRYDGTSVTMFLFTEKEWMWKRADDHYRLDAQWNGDELQYRPPFGKWTALATFTGARFEVADPTGAWIYEPVTDAMKDADDRVLDAPRPRHDYSIKPTDRP